MTPFITAGQSEINVDYNAEYDPGGNYVVDSQLFSYSQPNFLLDASVEDIISPDDRKINNRYNPICGRPVIVIKNTGSTPLTSLKIDYHTNPDTSYNWAWTGHLNFLDTQKVYLPAMKYQDFITDTVHTFTVIISEPNGGIDGYAANNSLSSHFSTVPVYTTQMMILLKTNHAASENSYDVSDANGNIIFHRDSLVNDTIYRDTLNLPYGCYELALHDAGDDGISFWNNNDGSGYFKFKRVQGAVVQTFNPDFGHEVRFQFIMNAPLLHVDENKHITSLSLYPNPNSGSFILDFILPHAQDFRVNIYDLPGRAVWTEELKQQVTGERKIDFHPAAPGVYIVQALSAGIVFTEKISVVW